METTDRYDALGIPMPVPWTCCKGGCEGIGVHPMPFDEWDSPTITRVPPVYPQKDLDDNWESWPPEDGSVMVLCQRCGGTGLCLPFRIAVVLEFIYSYYEPLAWIWTRQKVRFCDESRLDALKGTPFMVRHMWNELRPYRSLRRLRR